MTKSVLNFSTKFLEIKDPGYWLIPACTYLYKVNNGNTRIMCKISSKMKIKWIGKMKDFTNSNVTGGKDMSSQK